MSTLQCCSVKTTRDTPVRAASARVQWGGKGTVGGGVGTVGVEWGGDSGAGVGTVGVGRGQWGGLGRGQWGGLGRGQWGWGEDSGGGGWWGQWGGVTSLFLHVLSPSAVSVPSGADLLCDLVSCIR